MEKFSHQRECIISDLRGRKDHPTADMVYDSVREVLPNISLGTVYRNLSLLAESGRILKFSPGVGPDRFDGTVTPHCHFVCTCCGRVMDMDYFPEEDIVMKASQGFPGVICGYSLLFHGRCRECR